MLVPSLPPKTRLLNRALPLIILFAAVVVFFARVLLTRAYLLPWDFPGFHLPLAMSVFDAMKGSGSVLWETTTYCGRPLFADPQAQVFYPPTILTIFVSTFFDSSWLVYWLEWALALHVFAAGAFTYLLLRKMGVSTVGALCGGLVFELGGFFASQAQHFDVIDGAAWMPLMWAAAWQLRRGFVGNWFGALAIGSAMAILAGVPQMAITAIASTVVYSVILWAFGEGRIRGVFIVLAGVLAAVGLSAIMLAPAIQLVWLSVAKYRSEWAKGGGLSPEVLVTLVWPPNREKVSDLIFCGIGGSFLAAMAVSMKNSRKFAGPFACITLLSFVWMLGTGTLFGRALWAIVPRMVQGSLYPYYAMASFCLGVAALAGIGLDRIMRWTTIQKYAVALVVGAELIAVGSGRPMNASDVQKEPGITREQIDGSTAVMQRLRDLTKGNPPARIDTHAGPLALATAAPLTRIPTANGYNPLVLERLIQVRLSFAKGYRWGAMYEVEDLASPMIDALNLRYIISRNPIAVSAGGVPKYTLRADLPGFLVFENASALPRFFLVHRIFAAGTPEEAFSAIHKPDFTPSSVAVVEQPPPPEWIARVSSFQGNAGFQELTSEESTQVLHYGATEVLLAVRTKTPGFLVTSEVHYPGWRAWIDGSEVPLYMTNGAFRGLFVPEGNHAIRMAFQPQILYFGSAVSALFACAILFISRLKTA